MISKKLQKWKNMTEDEKVWKVANIMIDHFQKHGICEKLTDQHIKKELGVIPSNLKELKKKGR